MKHQEIQLDDDTSLLLAAIAESKDDPLSIAEVAQIDPTAFRKFISECGEITDENASLLLRAAESVHSGSIERNKGIDYPGKSSDNFAVPVTYAGAVVPLGSPLSLMSMLLVGLAVSLAYGLFGSSLIFYFRGKSESQLFFLAYTTSFKTILSLGLILGTALIAYRLQNAIPQTIESALAKTQLTGTDYFAHKRRFFSLRRSITFSFEFVIIAFINFSFCQFPLSRFGETLMLIAVCAEYALGMYVVRKLIYAAMMLHSLLPVGLTRNLFQRRELDGVLPYLHITSTLTIIFLIVHVIGYYGGPFLYGSVLGQSIRPFLILPTLMAILVLLTSNLFPRSVLQRLYAASINVEIVRLKKTLRNESLSPYERRFYLMEYAKMSRDDLRSSLKGFTLESLPKWITILITLLGPLLRR